MKNNNNLNTLCFFNSYHLWGGGEKWHFSAAKYFKQLGEEVVLMVPKDGELAKKSQQQKLGIPIIDISLNKYSYFNLWQIIRIIYYFKKFKVKSVVFNAPRDIRFAALAARVAGVKNIIYRNGMPVPIASKKSFIYAFKYGLNKIIPISQEVRRVMLETSPLLVKNFKLDTIIENAVDFTDYQAENISTKSEFSIPPGWIKPGDIILGNSARLSDQKGQIHLLAACKILKDKNIPFKLLIAGSGEKETHLRERVQTLGLSQHVLFLGHLNDVISFLSQIDIYVFSSLYEGTASSLVEAMAMKLPIVCFDISSMPELVYHGENGLLTAAFNEKQFAENIETLINSRELRTRFGERGYEIAQKKCDLKLNYGKKWYDILV